MSTGALYSITVRGQQWTEHWLPEVPEAEFEQHQNRLRHTEVIVIADRPGTHHTAQQVLASDLYLAAVMARAALSLLDAMSWAALDSLHTCGSNLDQEDPCGTVGASSVTHVHDLDHKGNERSPYMTVLVPREDIDHWLDYTRKIIGSILIADRQLARLDSVSAPDPHDHVVTTPTYRTNDQNRAKQ